MKLRQVLVRDYAKLRLKLMRRFGSADYATELLHDTYVRVGNTAAAVHSPEAYLYRVALNVAADHSREARRCIAKAEIEELRRRDDHELDPGQIMEARADLAELQRALDELPRRRREIFIAARLDECSHPEVAARLGVSVDTVDRELKRALDFFSKRLNKDRPAKDATKALKSS